MPMSNTHYWIVWILKLHMNAESTLEQPLAVGLLEEQNESAADSLILLLKGAASSQSRPSRGICPKDPFFLIKQYRPGVTCCQ